jgi:hypothetical protein
LQQVLQHHPCCGHSHLVTTSSLALAREAASFLAAAELDQIRHAHGEGNALDVQGSAALPVPSSSQQAALMPGGSWQCSLAEYGPATAAMRAAALSGPLGAVGLVDEVRLAEALGCASSRLVLDGIAW